MSYRGYGGVVNARTAVGIDPDRSNLLGRGVVLPDCALTVPAFFQRVLNRPRRYTSGRYMHVSYH